MQNKFIGEHVLITTSNWFIAPDGMQYRAVWGRLNAIHEAGKTLGFIPNRSHANWFIEVGDMCVMGCQVMYIVKCDKRPYDGEITENKMPRVQKLYQHQARRYVLQLHAGAYFK